MQPPTRSPGTHRALIKVLLPATMAGLFVAFAFVFFFTSALHDPKPNGMKVGVVAPPAAEAKIRAALDQAAPGGFDLRRYDTAAEARDAVADQSLDGALVTAPGRPILITAGALGATVGDVLRAAFGALAAAQGQRLATADVAPVPTHDARALSAFFLVAGTTIGSLVFAIALYFLGGHGAYAPIQIRLALIAAFAVLAGLVVGADTAWVADGLAGSFLAVAGVIALLSAAVSLSAAALARWLGAPGLALASLVFMLFSLPASGGPIGPQFVPDLYQSVAVVLPSHAALVALRGVVYFDGGGAGPAILVLLAWIAAALAAHLVAHLLGRRAPRPPVLGATPVTA
jgi:hypothetical protein